jgi:multidrug efflux pump subunit AcrA (membrane-fusion protein)
MVSDVLPALDATTRSLKVRLEMDNPKNLLLPEMFVDVEFPINLPSTLTVPASAMLDSGRKKTVFVSLGNGRFEPRTVETGWRFGDRVEIIRGLISGEKIVTSGNFLIDSESRMRLAVAGPSEAHASHSSETMPQHSSQTEPEVIPKKSAPGPMEHKHD